MSFYRTQGCIVFDYSINDLHLDRVDQIIDLGFIFAAYGVLLFTSDHFACVLFETNN